MLTPEGTYEYVKKGYVQIKIGKDKYTSKHRYLYEKYHNCKVPDSEIVVFLDGDKRNFDIDNLIKITRGEQVCMNRMYGGFIHSAEENLINLTLTRILMARHKLAEKNGILRNGWVPEDRTEYERKRYADPEYRRKKNEYNKKYKKEKYANDPVYREQQKELARKNRAAKSQKSR